MSSLNGRFRTFEDKCHTPPGQAPKMVATDGGKENHWACREKKDSGDHSRVGPLTSALSSTTLAPTTTSPGGPVPQGVPPIWLSGRIARLGMEWSDGGGHDA
jgi:hypothetical protein